MKDVIKKRKYRKIGLLGGSFNPAHEGHIHISQEALKRLGLDEVWWLVSPQNPLKSSNGMATLAERMDYAKNIAKDRRIFVTDIEAKLGTSYTAETLAHIQKKFRNCRFVWLMGADNLHQFPLWRNWIQIIDTVPIAVFGRSGYDLSALSGKVAQRFRRARVVENRVQFLAQSKPPAWGFMEIRRHPESATRIRNAGLWQIKK